MKRIIILLALLVFVFGCGLTGDGGEKTSRYGFGSTSGLSISFIEDQPPSEVVRDKAIRFGLNVKNDGVFSIPSGNFMARVIGLDNNFNPSEIQGANSEELKQVDESGVSEKIDVDLGSTIYSPEQMFNDRIIKSGDLQVEVCYPYETQVVMDNFWIGSKTSDVSKGSISSSSNSNAPVHVTDLEEKSSGTSTDFTFKVKVVGKGSVVSNCFPVSDGDRERKVDLGVIERDVSCYYIEGDEKKDIGSQGSIVLNTQNEKVIHCTIPFTGEKPVKSQLQMTLNYNYLDTLSVPGITITRL